VPFTRATRRWPQIPTVAVGLIRDVRQADAIIEDGSADLVALTRTALWIRTSPRKRHGNRGRFGLATMATSVRTVAEAACGTDAAERMGFAWPLEAQCRLAMGEGERLRFFTASNSM